MSTVQVAGAPGVSAAIPISTGVQAMLLAGSNNATTAQGKRSDVEYATELVKRHFDGRLVAFSGQFWIYRVGRWHAVDPMREIIPKVVALMVDEATAVKARRVLEMIRILYSVDPEDFQRRSNMLRVQNGTLDVTNRTLLRHDPENRLTTGLEIDYDPTATCPTFERYLQDVFGVDDDRVQKIAFLQEWMGYILTTDTTQHKFLWLVGGGANGKSTLLGVFTELVGHANVSFAHLDRLGQKVVRAELQNKALNISSEMPARATLADGYFKQIVSGEIVEAERKYQPSFSFKPHCRMIAATNTLPNLQDHSDGFFRRAIILRFNRQFTAAEQDRSLDVRLKQELSGILNFALEGLHRLRERGDFAVPPSANAEVHQYRVASNPVRQFAESYLTVTTDETLWVTGSDLYTQFCNWSQANGYPKVAINVFSERLQAAGFEKCRSRIARYWKAAYASSIDGGPAEVA